MPQVGDDIRRERGLEEEALAAGSCVDPSIGRRRRRTYSSRWWVTQSTTTHGAEELEACRQEKVCRVIEPKGPP